MFFKIHNTSQKEIIALMKQKFYEERLQEIHPWMQGTLPIAYCNVKNKDNDASRLISPSNKYPNRTLFALASKALTHLLKHLPSEYKQFTLYSMIDLKEEVMQIEKLLTNSYGLQTGILVTQTDVEKNVYKSRP